MFLFQTQMHRKSCIGFASAHQAVFLCLEQTSSKKEKGWGLCSLERLVIFFFGALLLVVVWCCVVWKGLHCSAALSVGLGWVVWCVLFACIFAFQQWYLQIFDIFLYLLTSQDDEISPLEQALSSQVIHQIKDTSSIYGINLGKASNSYICNHVPICHLSHLSCLLSVSPCSFCPVLHLHLSSPVFPLYHLPFMSCVSSPLFPALVSSLWFLFVCLFVCFFVCFSVSSPF